MIFHDQLGYTKGGLQNPKKSLNVCIYCMHILSRSRTKMSVLSVGGFNPSPPKNACQLESSYHLFGCKVTTNSIQNYKPVVHPLKQLVFKVIIDR